MKTPSARGLLKSLFLALFVLWGIVFRPSLCAQDAYWAPADLPKSHYVIDARLDLSPKGAIEGKETIVLKNTSRLPMSVISVNWSMGPAASISVTTSGSTLAPLNPEKKPVLSSPPVLSFTRASGSRQETETRGHVQEGGRVLGRGHRLRKRPLVPAPLVGRTATP